MSMERTRGLVAILLLVGIVAAAVLWRPAAPGSDSTPAQPALPTIVVITPTSPAEAESGQMPTLTPSPTSTLPPEQSSASPTPETFYASQLAGMMVASPGGSSSDDSSPAWNPPPMGVPIARHPNDHYWLIRPIASDSVNYPLDRYLYGSDGIVNEYRVHHGIDLVNPVGVQVMAAGSGTVIWAGRGHTNEYESISSYGNVIVIEHDFSYHGRPVYTLYAHLAEFLVSPGQHVQAGDPIGLIGDTGITSGSHLHFEVRVGRDSYYAVRNPMLWIAPYTGTGVVAGRVTDSDGQIIYDLSIALVNLETGSVDRRTSTYANYSVNADDAWGETFVFADMPAGHYLATASLEDVTWSGEVVVVPGATNWVEMARHEPAAGGIPTAP
jgi:murein DD-endopeptidase MepM/ murein hydrolase activator NlpD